MPGFHVGQCGVPSLLDKVLARLGNKKEQIDHKFDINAAVANAVDAESKGRWIFSLHQAHDLIERVAEALLARCC
jgi:hypothetical protein